PVLPSSGISDRQSSERNPEHERVAFLRGASAPGEVAVAPAVEQPMTAYELKAGTVIPAGLVTTVNSDLPGTIVAQVSRDVYDSRTESIVLVPKGTRLIGAYDDRIVSGQSRVLVAWTRMVFPDGRSVRLPGVEGVDAAGSAGVEGSVNDHLGHVFATAALMSALSAGAQLSQPETTGGTYAAPSAGQVAAGALGQEMSTVGLEMVRQGLSVKPTITVRGGAAVQVMLTQDVVFTMGYVDGRR
ncbi:MAG TPA: TrbI/VirB10 family protein, partial [Gemmatimonadaceae bacterium]|nr:TrbI/VirB10 family protein [Gemmatimonadaceae bacterium]